MAIQTKVFVRKVWPYGLLVVLCVLAYYPMFRNGFVWDDGKLIVENPTIQGLWPPARFLRSQSSALFALKGHRPLMFFSLAWDYAFWKLNPFGYHLTNFLLHLLCMFGVAFLVQKLSRSKGAGFLAGALFALLPGHAEAVIAFEGRSDLLAALFVLLGLWGYIAQLGSQGWRRALLYLGSLIAYVAACFSKETGLVLLGILVIYEGFVVGRSAEVWTRRALRLVPFLLIVLVYLEYRGHAMGGQTMGSHWYGGGPGKNFLMTFEVYAFYLRLLCFPLKLNPSPRIPAPGGFWDVRVLWGLALLLLTLTGAVWALRRKPEAGFFATWYLIALLPVANFIPIPGAMVAERWFYLPSVGACALGGWGAWTLYQRTRGWTRPVWAELIAVVLVLFGLRTSLWNPVWRDGVSMARALVAANPSEPRWRYYLGGALRVQGKYEEAEQELREALRLNPDDVEAHTEMGVVLYNQGKPPEAQAEYLEALRLDPNNARTHFDFGVFLWLQGNVASAEQEFREAVRLTPYDADALENLAGALDVQGKRKESREFLLRAEKLENRPERLTRIKQRLAEPD